MKPLNYSDAPTGDAQRDSEARAWRRMCDERAELERLQRVAEEAQKAADEFEALVRQGEGLRR